LAFARVRAEAKLIKAYATEAHRYAAQMAHKQDLWVDKKDEEGGLDFIFNVNLTCKGQSAIETPPYRHTTTTIRTYTLQTLCTFQLEAVALIDYVVNGIVLSLPLEVEVGWVTCQPSPKSGGTVEQIWSLFYMKSIKFYKITC